MARGRKAEDAPPQQPPITIEEARRRNLFGIYQVRLKSFAFDKPRFLSADRKYVGFAVDEESARRAAVNRGREARYPMADRGNGPRISPRGTTRSTYGCGHSKTPANTYKSEGHSDRCRRCQMEKSRRRTLRGVTS